MYETNMHENNARMKTGFALALFAGGLQEIPRDNHVGVSNCYLSCNKIKHVGLAFSRRAFRRVREKEICQCLTDEILER